MKLYKSYRAGDDHDWHNNISEGYDESVVYRNTEQYYLENGGDNAFEIAAFDDNDEEVGCKLVEFDKPIEQTSDRKEWGIWDKFVTGCK